MRAPHTGPNTEDLHAPGARARAHGLMRTGCLPSCRQQRRCSPPSGSSLTVWSCYLQLRPSDASLPAPAAAAGLSRRASTCTREADGRPTRPQSPAISRGPRGHPDRLVAPPAPPALRPRPQWPWRVAGTGRVATVGDRAALLATVARTWSIVSIAGNLAISRDLPEQETCYDHLRGLG